MTLFAVAGRYADWELLALVATLLPAMVLGLYIGNRISLRMDKTQFMRVLYVILMLTGSSLIIRASL